MVTLAKRATPAQHQILKIIVGAVLNTFDAHKIERDERLARSIAKRAAGILSARWPEVLAANYCSSRPPETGQATLDRCLANERCIGARQREHAIAHLGKKRLPTHTMGRVDPPARAGYPQISRRTPLLILWKRLQMEMWQIRRSGNQAKLEAYIDLLRMIDQLNKGA